MGTTYERYEHTTCELRVANPIVEHHVRLSVCPCDRVSDVRVRVRVNEMANNVSTQATIFRALTIQL